MRRILAVAAGIEIATGLALLILPSQVAQLLLGQELSGVAVAVGRLAGIALIALGIGCWPGPALAGLVIYNAMITAYLAYLGVAEGLTGVLLWPAVALHLVLTVLLGLTWIRDARVLRF